MAVHQAQTCAREGRVQSVIVQHGVTFIAGDARTTRSSGGGASAHGGTVRGM